MDMQPRSLPTHQYTSRCYITNLYIGKSVHLLLGQPSYSALQAVHQLIQWSTGSSSPYMVGHRQFTTVHSTLQAVHHHIQHSTQSLVHCTYFVLCNIITQTSAKYLLKTLTTKFSFFSLVLFSARLHLHNHANFDHLVTMLGH